MNDQELAAIEAESHRWIAHPGDAERRNEAMVRALVAEVRRLRAENDRRETAMLAVIQQVFDAGGCDFCDVGPGVEHASWCIVPVLRAALGQEGGT